MNPQEMKARTKTFALRVVRLVDALPRRRSAEIIGRQLLRSGTSVGANYRAACRAKSAADFIAKMGTVEEEADECAYWLEMLVESGLIKDSLVQELRKECDELLSIVVASIRTARKGAGIQTQAIRNPKSAIRN